MRDAIGIAILDRVPCGIARVAAPASHCAFAGLARDGAQVWAASEDIACPIARHILGCELSGEGLERAAAAFVASTLAPDREAALRFAHGFRTLDPRRRVFVYFPWDDAPLPADVGVWFLPPDVAMMRLRALITATGERAEVRTGGSAAMCGDCTASPLVTGRAALSAGCPGSRRELRLDREHVLLAVPGSFARAGVRPPAA